MAKPRILVASTCEDHKMTREQLRDFINNLGYEPVLSEYGDIYYNPSNHTHISCVNEVKQCDMVVFLIGGRLGGTAVPEVYDIIDFDSIDIKNEELRAFLSTQKVSITQMEVLKALECNIPVYTLIEEALYNAHHIYETNKNNDAVNRNDIFYPQLDKHGTAATIFEFFNLIRRRQFGNAIKEWKTYNEAIDFLKSQLAGLVKQQLETARENRKQYDFINSKIVNHNSIERKNAFDELFTEIDEKDEIKILGTGVTKFLSDKENVETFLKNENHIKILLVNDQMVKSDWACSSKQFIEKFNFALVNSDEHLISELEAKTSCPLAVTNILIDQNHFNNYYQRDTYSEEIKTSYELIDYYREKCNEKKWLGTLTVKQFHSFIPLSITAIFPDHSINRKLLVEFIIPFTENRILFKSSLKNNKNIYKLFMDFFDETWKRAIEI